MQIPAHTPQHFTDRHPRSTGLIILVFAGILAQWQILGPLVAAEEGKPELWVSGWLVGLAIGLGLYGAALSLFGKNFVIWLRYDPQNVGWRFAIASSALALTGVGVYVWIMFKLAAFGYVSKPFGL